MDLLPADLQSRPLYVFEGDMGRDFFTSQMLLNTRRRWRIIHLREMKEKLPEAFLGISAANIPGARQVGRVDDRYEIYTSP
jgi:hypothetical protein